MTKIIIIRGATPLVRVYGTISPFALVYVAGSSVCMYSGHRWPSRPAFRSWILTGRGIIAPCRVAIRGHRIGKPEFTCLADKNSAPLPENIVIHPRRVISSVLRRVSLTRFTIISRSPSLPASSPLPIPFLLLSFSRSFLPRFCLLFLLDSFGARCKKTLRDALS